jgi:hypothetical protein
MSHITIILHQVIWAQPSNTNSWLHTNLNVTEIICCHNCCMLHPHYSWISKPSRTNSLGPGAVGRYASTCLDSRPRQSSSSSASPTSHHLLHSHAPPPPAAGGTLATSSRHPHPQLRRHPHRLASPHRTARLGPPPLQPPMSAVKMSPHNSGTLNRRRSFRFNPTSGIDDGGPQHIRGSNPHLRG